MGFSQLAKPDWRQGRISEYIAAVVVGVAAVIAVAQGVQGNGDEGAADASRKALVASLYAIAALALTAAAARQRQRWCSGTKGGSGGGCNDNTKGHNSGV